MDATGRALAALRLPDGVEGITRLHALIADHSDDVASEQVLIAIETDRGPWVTALIAAGYRVFAVNPRQTGRFRERLILSGAKVTLRTLTRWRTWCGPTPTSCVLSQVTATCPR